MHKGNTGKTGFQSVSQTWFVYIQKFASQKDLLVVHSEENILE